MISDFTVDLHNDFLLLIIIDSKIHNESHTPVTSAYSSDGTVPDAG